METPSAETPSSPPLASTSRAVIRQERPSLLPYIGVGLITFLLGLGAGSLLTHRQDAGDTVASINGEPLRKPDFYHRLEVAAGTPVLRQMTQEQIRLQFAQKEGVLPTNQEVEAKYAEAAKQPDFAKKLAASHQTPEDVKRSIRVQLAEAAVIHKGVTVTDAEIRAFYDANINRNNPNTRYYRPETVQVVAIVTENEAKAKEALAELARSRAFADVARQYSKDRSSAANGGLLPAVQKGRMDTKKFPGLEDKLFAMKGGDQIGPLQVAGAWWILRCVGKAPETQIPFEKVAEECRTGALLTKGLQAHGADTQKAFADFEKTADIKILWPQYKDADKTK